MRVVSTSGTPTSHRSFAAHAVKALEQYFALLLGVADVLAHELREPAGREMRPALERAIRALHVLRKELAVIEVMEERIARQQRPVQS